MSKYIPAKHKPTIKPEPAKGSISIAGKKVVVGSIEVSEGSPPDKIVKSLREASKKRVFPPPSTPVSLNE